MGKPLSVFFHGQCKPQPPDCVAALAIYITLDNTDTAMGQSASQAHAFYRDVAKNKIIWALCDAGGYACATNNSGQKTMGFWSSLSRVKTTKKNFEAYSLLEPDEISWENFRDKWLPGLKKDGYLVGLNWSGANVVGYDCEPDWVLEAIELQIQAQSNA